jgi:hypothetical protein
VNFGKIDHFFSKNLRGESHTHEDQAEEIFPPLRVCVQSCRRMRPYMRMRMRNVFLNNFMLLNSFFYTLNVNSKIQNVLKEKNHLFLEKNQLFFKNIQQNCLHFPEMVIYYIQRQRKGDDPRKNKRRRDR